MIVLLRVRGSDLVSCTSVPLFVRPPKGTTVQERRSGPGLSGACLSPVRTAAISSSRRLALSRLQPARSSITFRSRGDDVCRSAKLRASATLAAMPETPDAERPLNPAAATQRRGRTQPQLGPHHRRRNPQDPPGQPECERGDDAEAVQLRQTALNGDDRSRVEGSGRSAGSASTLVQMVATPKR